MLDGITSLLPVGCLASCCSLNLVVESDTLTLSAHDCCVLGGGGAGLTLGCGGVAVVFWVVGSLRVAISCVLFGVIAVDESWLGGSRGLYFSGCDGS